MQNASRTVSTRIRALAVALAGCVALAGWAPAQAAAISGRIVAYGSGKPLVGISVAVAPSEQGFEAVLAGDQPPGVSDGIAQAVTGPDGRFVIDAAPRGGYFLDAFGATRAYVTFHGTFRAGLRDVGTISLIAPTRDERQELDEVNRFRGAPGGNGRLGVSSRLVFDENLMESARFWAAVEVRAGRIGHTCATLGNPAGCIEFNTFFHALAGAPPDWFAGQNAAFDTIASWSDPNLGFEDEGRSCAQAYDWHTCPRSGHNETGHFINLMTAQRWAGFGSQALPGAGVYYAMNVI